LSCGIAWGFFVCFTKKSSFLFPITEVEKDLINSSASVGAGFQCLVQDLPYGLDRLYLWVFLKNCWKATFFTKNAPNNDISVKAISQHTVLYFVRVIKMAQSKHVSIFWHFQYFDVLRKIQQNNNFGISLRNLTHKYKSILLWKMENARFLNTIFKNRLLCGAKVRITFLHLFSDNRYNFCRG